MHAAKRFSSDLLCLLGKGRELLRKVKAVSEVFQVGPALVKGWGVTGRPMGALDRVYELRPGRVTKLSLFLQRRWHKSRSSWFSDPRGAILTEPPSLDFNVLESETKITSTVLKVRHFTAIPESTRSNFWDLSGTFQETE